MSVRSVGVIGAGRIATNLISLIKPNISVLGQVSNKAGLQEIPSGREWRINVYDPDTRKANLLSEDLNVIQSSSLGELVRSSGVIFIASLCVRNICKDISLLEKESEPINNKIIVSTSLGSTICQLRESLTIEDANIIRLIPITCPAGLRNNGSSRDNGSNKANQSLIWYSDDLHRSDKDYLTNITKGPNSVWLENEDQMTLSALMFYTLTPFLSAMSNECVTAGSKRGINQTDLVNMVRSIMANFGEPPTPFLTREKEYISELTNGPFTTVTSMHEQSASHLKTILSNSF